MLLILMSGEKKEKEPHVIPLLVLLKDIMALIPI